MLVSFDTEIVADHTFNIQIVFELDSAGANPYFVTIPMVPKVQFVSSIILTRGWSINSRYFVFRVVYPSLINMTDRFKNNFYSMLNSYLILRRREIGYRLSYFST